MKKKFFRQRVRTLYRSQLTRKRFGHNLYGLPSIAAIYFFFTAHPFVSLFYIKRTRPQFFPETQKRPGLTIGSGNIL